MVKLNLNLDEVGTKFEVLEAGRYRAKVTEIEEKDSSKGNPMLVWTWEIVDGEFAGKEIRSYASLQDHALFGLKEHLTAFGYDGEIEVDTEKLTGKIAIIVVTKEEIENKDKSGTIEVNRVKSVYKLEKTSGPSSGSAIKKPVVQGKGVKGRVPF
jgi:hypothetical protein